MIAYKSFEVKDSEALNEFIKEHPPLANQEANDAGISLHNGYFIVRYEDGTFNEKAVKSSALHQAINSSKNTIVVKGIEAAASEQELFQMFPGLTFEEIAEKGEMFFVEYYKEKKIPHQKALELSKKVQESIRSKLMAEFEIDRTLKVNIPILEKLLELHK